MWKVPPNTQSKPPSSRRPRRRRRTPRFRKTEIAASRPSSDTTRSVALNVRAEPQQYLRWRRAADRAGMSLSSWVAAWLDELAGVPVHARAVVEKLAPHYGGRVPLQLLEIELSFRRGFVDRDCRAVLSRLAELGLIELLALDDNRLLERIAPPNALRTAEGRLVTHVALPTGLRPRPKRPRP